MRGICQKCGRTLTPENVSLKSGVCMLCRIKSMRRFERGQTVFTPGYTLCPDSAHLTPSGTAAFCGHKWGDPIVNPVG